MNHVKELITAIEYQKPLIWNDPEPIEGNDYTISWIEGITSDFDQLDPILIQYNNGQSEAQVFLHEIFIKMNLEKHIWEGWTVQSFINELEPTLNMIMSGNSWQKSLRNKKELKKWCMENQPYYKKYIPEVVNYFANKYNIK